VGKEEGRDPMPVNWYQVRSSRPKVENGKLVEILFYFPGPPSSFRMREFSGELDEREYIYTDGIPFICRREGEGAHVNIPIHLIFSPIFSWR